MSVDPRLPRWTEQSSDAPDELRDWLRASREQVAPAADIVQLSRSLAQRLGPEAGLVASRAPTALGKVGFAGRWAAWLAAGATSAALVWYLASGPAHSVAAPVVAGPVAAAPAAAAPAATAELSVPAAAEPAEPAAPEPALERVVAARPAVAPHPCAPAARCGRNVAPAPRASEAALLERAQSLLAAQPLRALALTVEHRRLFAQGVLAEEREAIAIDALRQLGRERAASERAAAFVAKYPNSVHRSRVQATPVPR